jgi:predicted Zn-dependent protease
MAHDIHHDVLNLARKRQNTGLIAGALDVILGGGAPVGAILQTATQLQNLSFSRTVEEAADQTGARLCARADENPWGTVWLFEQYSKAGAGGAMEILSDHPTDRHRISALKAEFHATPALFGKYSARRSSGHHIPSLAYLRKHYERARAR